MSEHFWRLATKSSAVFTHNSDTKCVGSFPHTKQISNWTLAACPTIQFTGSFGDDPELGLDYTGLCAQSQRPALLQMPVASIRSSGYPLLCRLGYKDGKGEFPQPSPLQV